MVMPRAGKPAPAPGRKLGEPGRGELPVKVLPPGIRKRSVKAPSTCRYFPQCRKYGMGDPMTVKS